MSAPFIVEHWHGRCPGCDDPIRPGDSAAYVEGELLHAFCAKRTEPRPICPGCFTEIALNGKCWCPE